MSTGTGRPTSTPQCRREGCSSERNLQALIDQCYENGGYDNIDYRQPPVPPLDPDGAAGAEKWLRAKGVLP